MSLKGRVLLLVPALLGLITISAGLVGLQSVRKIVLATPEPIVVQAKSVTVVASNGTLLRPFTTPKGYWRIPVQLDDVDPRLLTFLLAYEDQRFYEHNGIDKRAMLRAAGQLILNGRIVSGASTLTMQVARLLSDQPTRNAAGKIQQIVQAQKLETKFTKREILELYLNHAPYGGNLEGVRAASWAYFGKEPKWLNLAEIALLIALPQAPESRRPDRFYERAFHARARVLDRLLIAGLVTPDDADRAANAPLPGARHDFPMLAPHVAQELKSVATDRSLVKTTIDYDLQASLETHITQRSAGLGKGFSIAVMVADHQSGDILASVGGPGLLSGNSAAHLNMTKAVRSPGSTLKPLIYGLGFEAGLAHPNTMIDDRPSAFADYTPENFDTGFHGSMSISEALQMSLNIPAIAVLDKVDPHRLASRLQRAGAAPRFLKGAKPGLAMGLGGVGLTLEELVYLYGAIARGGSALNMHIKHEVDVTASKSRVLSASATGLLIKAMQQKTDRHHVHRGNLIYKTGTSYGYRDAWALGFDGQHVVGVWVGRPDNAPAGHMTGATAALPIFFDVFARMGTRPHPDLDGTALMSNAELPTHLKRFGKTTSDVADAGARPVIAFPRSGTELPLPDAASVALKVRGGSAPFTWLADGRPVAMKALRRESLYHPEGPGFSTLTVIDAKGRTDQVSIRLTN
ncbi:MAG: penicillin-binding protein 1C [Hyphomicrobiales bacterium]|uniref:penicillin-binding protein 1C n=1 Tax=Nisaea sp. TaxID=2024842 RepID=UPI0032736821